MFKSKKRKDYSSLIFNKISEIQEIGKSKNVKEFMSNEASLAVIAWIGYAIFVEETYKFSINVVKDALHDYSKARGCTFEERESFREFTACTMNKMHEISMELEVEDPADIILGQIVVFTAALGIEYNQEMAGILLDYFTGILIDINQIQ